ncbi:MAG: hypothetical protein WCL44_08435 [bacterium]
MSAIPTARLTGQALMLLLATALISGCLVVSVNPWIDPKKAVATPSLAGDWVDTNQNQSATFSFEPRNSYYDLTLKSAGNQATTQYRGTMHTVGDALLLQLGPGEKATANSPGALLPVHMLFRVELSTNTMRLYPLSRQGFEARALSNMISIAESPDRPGDKEPVIVTAKTATLETFLGASIRDRTLFTSDPAYSFSTAPETATAVPETQSTP